MHVQMHVHTAFMNVAKPPISRLTSRACMGIPAACGPVGGGLIKMGHGSNWAAVTVAIIPYATCVLVHAAFVIGYLCAVLRYLCSGEPGQCAMERLIAISANAVVALLTLTTLTLTTLTLTSVTAEGGGRASQQFSGPPRSAGGPRPRRE